MRVIVALLLSFLMTTETVYAMPPGSSAVCMQEEGIQETEDGQESDEEQEETKETTAEQLSEQGQEESTASDGPQISAPSAVLMEKTTGTVIFEKDADTERPPASVTKVMTMLLIFDALAEGKIHLEDEVVVSEFAASMGGSQVYLEPGETQTVDTMLKCISVASANDACASSIKRDPLISFRLSGTGSDEPVQIFL